MSTFVYYNPETNQIEQRRQLPSKQQSAVPYLMTILPEDFNFAIRKTEVLNHNNPNFVAPNFLTTNTESQFTLAKFDDLKKFEPKSSNVQEPKPVFLQVMDITACPPIKKANGNENTKGSGIRESVVPFKTKAVLPPTQDFLSVENISESDMTSNPQYMDSFDNMKLPRKETTKTTKFVEKESELPLTAELLGGRALAEERRKTQKFQMDTLAKQLTAMDKNLNEIEKDTEHHGKDSEEMEQRMKALVHELECRALERQANKIMADMEGALQDKDENYDPNMTHRLDNFYKENEELFDEINHVMGKAGNASLSEISMTSSHITGNLSKLKGRTSSLSKNHQNSYYPTVDKFNKKPKKVLATTVNSKLTSFSKIQMRKFSSGSQGKRPEFEVKNPKKVEHLLEKAKNLSNNL